MKNLVDRRGGSVQARGPLEGWVHNQIKPCFVSLHTYCATYCRPPPTERKIETPDDAEGRGKRESPSSFVSGHHLAGRERSKPPPLFFFLGRSAETQTEAAGCSSTVGTDWGTRSEGETI